MTEAPKLTCPVCGSESLSEGLLLALTSAIGIFPVDVGELDKPKPAVKRETLMARRCAQCNNVQPFMGKPKSK